MSENKTIGERRVRADFNPSNATLADLIKQKSAELINLLEAEKNTEVSKTYEAGEETLRLQSGEKLRLIAIAQTTFEQAAMWGVKAVTA